MESQSVVDHETQEALLGPYDTLTRDDLHRIPGATHAAAMFAACVAGKRERSFIEQPLRVVVVLDLNAVVGV